MQVLFSSWQYWTSLEFACGGSPGSNCCPQWVCLAIIMGKPHQFFHMNLPTLSQASDNSQLVYPNLLNSEQAVFQIAFSIVKNCLMLDHIFITVRAGHVYLDFVDWKETIGSVKWDRCWAKLWDTRCEALLATQREHFSNRNVTDMSIISLVQFLYIWDTHIILVNKVGPSIYKEKIVTPRFMPIQLYLHIIQWASAIYWWL